MEDRTELNPWFEANIFKIALIVLLALAVIIGAVAIITFFSKENWWLTKIFLSLSNLVVAIAFCWSLKKYHLYFKQDEKGDKQKSIRDFWDSLGLLDVYGDHTIVEVGGKKVDAIKLAEYNEERVNTLIDQYISHIYWFAALLAVLYGIFVIDALNESYWKEWNEYFFTLLDSLLKLLENILDIFPK